MFKTDDKIEQTKNKAVASTSKSVKRHTEVPVCTCQKHGVQKFPQQQSVRGNQRNKNQFWAQRTGLPIRTIKRCFNCGRTNHLAKQCYYKQKVNMVVQKQSKTKTVTKVSPKAVKRDTRWVKATKQPSINRKTALNTKKIPSTKPKQIWVVKGSQTVNKKVQAVNAKTETVNTRSETVCTTAKTEAVGTKSEAVKAKTAKPSAPIIITKHSSHQLPQYNWREVMKSKKVFTYNNAKGEPKTTMVWVLPETN